jgi:hypothetical protein
MAKNAALISLALGLVTTGLIRIPGLQEPPGYGRFSLNAAELKRESQFLDEQLQARSGFKAIEDDILNSLAQGKLSLAQACDRLYQRAHQVYPRFLRFLRDPKLTLKERMARNLVEFFHLEADVNPSCAEVLRRLERDLASPTFCDWCRKPWQQE